MLCGYDFNSQHLEFPKAIAPTKLGIMVLTKLKGEVVVVVVIFVIRSVVVASGTSVLMVTAVAGGSPWIWDQRFGAATLAGL